MTINIKLEPESLHKTSEEAEIDDQDSVVLFRGSTAKDLLKFANSWVGDDLEECLQAVYDNRSQAKFD